jgi:hypothetical protein
MKRNILCKPTAHQLFTAAFVVCINVLLFSMVGALFVTALSASGGRMLL